MARLQDLGIPVAAARGPGGCYRLKPGFRLPPLMFGTEEALAVALGLDALTFLGLRDVAPATAGAKAKLERVLPEAVSAQVRALRNVLELERPPWLVDADIALLTRLATAIHLCKRVRLAYAARDGAQSDRVLESLGLMQHQGRWFLAGHCLLRQGLRLFRVDRIRTVVMLNEPFARPEGFEMAAFVRDSLAYIPASWEAVVWLECPPEVLERRWLGARAKLEPEAGGTRLRCGTDDLDALAVSLLHLGCRLEVRRPAELVVAFRAVVERAKRVVVESG